MSHDAEVRIQIPCAQGGFPTDAEMELRNALEDEIEKRGIGEVVDAGSGMGVMTLAIAVSNPKMALRTVTALLEEIAPESSAACRVVLPSKSKPPTVPFQPGDCVSVRLEDGDFGAALVLARTEDPGIGTSLLVGSLRYKAPASPGVEVFASRDWLTRRHHGWKGKRDLYWCLATDFPANAGRLRVVTRVDLLSTDPVDSRTVGSWSSLGKHAVLQARWDAGSRE